MTDTTTSTTTPPVDPVDLADAFFAVSQALKRSINARVQPTGLSLARLKVLFQLATTDGVRLGELSTFVDVAPRTMTSTIEAMERDGLVARRPDPNDGRATIVTITEAGRRSFAEGRRVQAAVVADLFASVDTDQQVALAAVLDRLGHLAGLSEADGR